MVRLHHGKKAAQALVVEIGRDARHWTSWAFRPYGNVIILRATGGSSQHGRTVSVIASKLGIVIPSTNTIVQPETDAMRPPGVTNHIGRIHIGDLPLTNDTGVRAHGRAPSAPTSTVRSTA